jgi:hypothetical protein
VDAAAVCADTSVDVNATASVETAKRERTETATIVQYAVEAYNVREEEVEREIAATTQHAVRDRNVRKEAITAESEERTEVGSTVRTDSGRTQILDEDDGFLLDDVDHTSSNVSKETGSAAKIDPTSRLGSSELRRYIVSELLDFKASEATLDFGNTGRPIFFYKEDAGPNKERVYIALAHNSDFDDLATAKGGERRLSKVLEDIKKHLGDVPSYSILIPLQQTSKAHWTLLEIKKSTSLAASVSVTHYDSKSRCSLSYLRDISTTKAWPRIKKCVQKTFSVEFKLKRVYDDKQGFWDFHNCGRYVLIKLRHLLDPEAKALSLENIDRSLNREEHPNTREKSSGWISKLQNGARSVRDHLSRTRTPSGIKKRTSNDQDRESDTLSEESSDSEDWEVMESVQDEKMTIVTSGQTI